ncbi:hypothetical protein [Stutzerimonas stutzeri]
MQLGQQGFTLVNGGAQRLLERRHARRLGKVAAQFIGNRCRTDGGAISAR